MEYVDQSAYGLRFYLVAGALDVTPFTVISTTSCMWGSCRVDMGILGASHFIRIDQGGGEVLTELFACAEVDTDEVCLRSAPFAKLPARVESPFVDMLYHFSPRLVSWSDGADELSELMGRISETLDSTSVGLHHQFPSLPGDDESKPPLTLVHASVGDQLILTTAHCYPNEEQIVFTTTTLSNRGG